MSFTKSKNDACFSKQQQSSNKSVFDYVVDNSKFVNQNECFDNTSGFIAYIPTGVSVKNVDIENDLKGMTRPYTRCIDCQYQSTNVNLPQLTSSNKQYNKKECEAKLQILPNGYIVKK